MKRHDVNVEAILAINTVKRAIFVAPIVIGIFAVIAGWPGAAASSVGVAVVVVNFLATGWILSVAARISLGAYHAAALFGFFIRLGLLLLTMILITRVVDLDRLAFGISTVVTYLGLLIWETVAVSRGNERELEWIN